MLTNCESCHVQAVESCLDTATLTVGLNPATQYTVFMQDKFDTIYTQDIITDAEGNIELDLTAIDLAFTPYGGSYEITVSNNNVTNTAETLTIAGSTYTCINLSFYNKN